MAGFNIDQHLVARHNRLRTWTIAMGVSIVATVANMYMVLAFASSASLPAKVALATVIVSVTLYAILNTKTAVEEFVAIRDDKVSGLAGTNYQKNYDNIPLGQFLMLSNVLYGVMGLTQLWALFAG